MVHNLKIHENWVQQDTMNNVLGFGATSPVGPTF